MNRVAAATAAALTVLALTACTPTAGQEGAPAPGDARTEAAPVLASELGELDAGGGRVTGTWGAAAARGVNAVDIDITDAAFHYDDGKTAGDGLGSIVGGWTMTGTYEYVKDVTRAGLQSGEIRLGDLTNMVGPLYAPDSPVCTSGVLRTVDVSKGAAGSVSDGHKPYCALVDGYYPWGPTMLVDNTGKHVEPGVETTQQGRWSLAGVPGGEEITDEQAGPLMEALAEPAMWAAFDARWPSNGSRERYAGPVVNELVCPGQERTNIYAATAAPECVTP